MREHVEPSRRSSSKCRTAVTSRSLVLSSIASILSVTCSFAALATSFTCFRRIARPGASWTGSMTSSMTRSPLSEVERDSEDLATAVKQRLGWFCGHPSAHARFLNTLSLMEHIGSRKIMMSQTSQDPGGDTLRHLAEETRHAYFFKRAAEKLARGTLGYGADETVAGAAARFYMERLDAGIVRSLDGAPASALPYLYMSLIVELRAVWFYRLYQETLTQHE